MHYLSLDLNTQMGTYSEFFFGGGIMDLRKIFEANLRGKDYITARGLSPEVVSENTHICITCQKQEQLPMVLRILANYRVQGDTGGNSGTNDI